MKTELLVPPPTACVPFRLTHQLKVPSAPGCYVLTTQDNTILYVGLSISLRRRFEDHWDTPEKRALTPLGRAIWFHWIECEDLEKIERSWMSGHLAIDGKLPHLNKIYSPTAT